MFSWLSLALDILWKQPLSLNFVNYDVVEEEFIRTRRQKTHFCRSPSPRATVTSSLKIHNFQKLSGFVIYLWANSRRFRASSEFSFGLRRAFVCWIPCNLSYRVIVSTWQAIPARVLISGLEMKGSWLIKRMICRLSYSVRTFGRPDLGSATADCWT
jgi:hypothetical protein